jgi:hypothetical protein
MSNVKVVRAIPLLLVALLLPIVAGCGSVGKAGSAASVVPADAALYVSADTSFSGSQWRAVRDLVRKFPEGEDLVDELLEEAAKGAKTDPETLKDALGPELAVVALDMGQGQDPTVVILSQPEDVDAFRSLGDDGKTVYGEVNGWQAAADDEQSLDRYREALEQGSLEGNQDFDDAMDDLDDGLIHVYVNGKEFMQALATQPGLPPGSLPMLSGDVGSIGAVVRAEDDGIRLEGRAVGAEQGGREPFRSELVEEIPAGVIAFAAFDGLGESLTSGAQGMEGFLPFDLDEIARLFDGETAVYVRPGTPQPSVTLVTEVDDEAAALETAKGLVALAGQGPTKLSVEAFDGLLVVSTSKDEIAALRGDGPRLDQDDAFEHAADQAGLPDETTGFGYVDLQALVPLFLGFAPTTPLPVPEVSEYLEPLGGIVFWGGNAGDVQDFSVFVGID